MGDSLSYLDNLLKKILVFGFLHQVTRRTINISATIYIGVVRL